MAWIVGAVAGGITLFWLAWNLTLDALWQPTDRVTVQRILQLAEIHPGEQLIDLGCGDGRIVVHAAKRYGAQGVGVEIDPFRVLYARIWCLLAGVSRRTRILQANMYTVPIEAADVVVLFLSATANFRLQERLRRELQLGTRVISYYHPMWGWTPDIVGEGRDGYPIYVYRIGESVGKTTR